MTEPETQLQASEIGDALREAREQRAMEPEQAVAACELDPRTIETLEQHDPADWGTDPRLLAALRVYGRTVGVDPEPLVTAAWRASRPAERPRPASVEPLIPATAYRHARPGRRRWMLLGAAAVPVLVAGAVALAVLGVPLTLTAFDASPSSSPEAETVPEPTRPTEPDDTVDEEAQEGEEPEAADEAESEEEETAGTEEALPGQPPQDTPVQVLNALDDEELTAQVTEHLEDLGYEIALVDTTIRLWENTAVYYNEGWETEAESLQSRDDRFPVGGANESFVDDAGLHVVIGLDWVE